MTCDNCNQQMNYSFYINDEDWRKVVGDEKFKASQGRICAHCTLQKLGGIAWYIVWNEPSAKIAKNAEQLESRPCSECESLAAASDKENEGVPAANDEAGDAFLAHMAEMRSRGLGR